MLVGYAGSRRSPERGPPGRRIAGRGVDAIFTESASGAQRDRPELKAALDYMREGDTLVVWRLDRLSRKTMQSLEIIEGSRIPGCISVR